MNENGATKHSLFGEQIMQGILERLMTANTLDWREHLTQEFGDKVDSNEYKLLQEINTLEHDIQDTLVNVNAKYGKTQLFTPPTVTQANKPTKISNNVHPNLTMWEKLGARFSGIF